jgi:Trypsin-like peptidase domain
LLGLAGGVKPGFVHNGLGELDKEKLATLDSEITSWKLFLPDAEDRFLNVAGLYGNARQLDESCDQVLLRLAPTTNSYPVTPLDLRLSPVTTAETLYVLTYVRDTNDCTQQVAHKVHRMPGLGFNCVMETPAKLNGFSGAPIVDTNGLLVGILTDSFMLGTNNPSSDKHNFTGHLASELMPVLEEAVAVKGMTTLTPIKTVSKTSVQTGNTSPAKPAGNPI